MDFLEKDLEEIIYSSGTDELNDRGLEIYGKLYRQLHIGNYGIADLISAYKNYSPELGTSYLDITIIELKQKKIGISAFLQAVRYARGIQSFLTKRGTRFTLSICLIGHELDDEGSFCFLSSLIRSSYECGCKLGFLDAVDFYTYSYQLDGIYFNNEKGYKLTNEGL